MSKAEGMMLSRSWIERGGRSIQIAARAVLLTAVPFSLPALSQDAAPIERILEDALAVHVPAQVEVSRERFADGSHGYRFMGHDQKLLLIVRFGDGIPRIRAPHGASAETLRLPGLTAQSLKWSNAAGMRFGEIRVRWHEPGPGGVAQLSYGPLEPADATLVQQTIGTLRRAP